MIEPRSRPRFGRAISLWSPVARYGAAIVAVLATTGLIALLDSDWAFFEPVPIENPGTIFIATVTLVALVSGVGPALLAAAASMLTVFLAFSRYENFERSVILVATMLIIIGLAEWQRRARDVAEQAQAKFAAIMESMRDAVMVVDAAGHATDANRAAVAMLGAADHADALAKMTRRHADGTAATDEYALLERALAGEEAPQGDVLIPDAPGGPRIASAVASPMRDAYDRIIGAVSVSRDMTDRLAQTRERESLLRRIEQEQQYTQLVLDTAPVAIGVVRPDDLMVTSANEVFEASIGALAGKPFTADTSLMDALPGYEASAFVRQLRAAAAENRTYTVVGYAARFPEGRHYDWTMKPFALGDETRATLVTFADVTERVQADQERERLHILVEERRRFAQAIFDTVPVALAVIDTDAMTISAANPAYLEATPEPYRSQGVYGHAVADILPHATENGFIAQLRMTGQAGTPFETPATTYEHPTRGTTYWNETMIPLAMTDPAARHVLYIAADITKEVEARQRIAALARERAERAAELEAIITNIPDGVAIYARDGRLRQMNIKGQQIVGEVPKPGTMATENAERSAFRYSDGRPIPFDDLPLPRALRGEIVSDYEFISHTEHGDIYLLSSGAPIRNAAGEITSAVIMFMDITARKHAEQERERLLQEVEEGRLLAQTVIDSAPTGIVVFGADSGFTVRLANDQFLPLVREPWRSAGVVGAPLAAFLPRAEESGVLPIFRRVAETGDPVSLSEFEYEDEGGRIISYDWSLVPLREGGGGVTGLILLITDVTDRVLSRQRIEELADAAAQRAAELEAIIANMPDGVAIYDADGQLVQINAAGNAISGEELSPDDALPAVVEHFDLRYPDGRVIPLDDLPLPRALRGETVSGYAFVSHTRHGDRIILMSSAPITDVTGKITSAVVVFSDITERRRTQELTTRLGRILDASSNEIYVYDAVSLRLLQVNESARRNLGYTMDELHAMTTLDLQPEFSVESFAALIVPLRAGERDEIVIETTHRRKDGSDYPVEAHLLLSRAETPPVFVSIIQDITERHAAEQQRERLLREIDGRRRFVQTVVESAPVGIAAFGMDADLTVRMANDQYLQLLDEPWRTEGIIGRGVREFVPDADATGLTALVQQVAAQDETIALHEFAFDGFGRGTGYFDASIVPLRESGAGMTGILTVVADVTERVQSRQRIEELAWGAAQRARELETVIASIADGVMVTDAEGRIVLENAASRRLTGRTQSAVSFDLETQVTAQDLRDPGGTPMPPDDLPLGRAVRGEMVTEQVLIVRRADTGEDRFLMCSSAPVRDDSGAITGAVAVFRDITEMKQLDQMKDEFVSIAAHELRTPLTAIKGYAELLDRRLRSQGGRESDLRSLGVIRKQTERLAGLVNEMLDVSRIEAGRLQLNSEPFDLSMLVGEVINSMRVSSETHHLSLTAEPGIEVNGDIARIEQVLLNLIANAITYAPAGGEIAIRVWTDADSALVSVRDHGVGIAPDELPHLFDRFYRAPRAGVMRSGGMGLGLYICREIIARHGGAIRVESAEDAGSTFTFSLPLARPES
ncbi:MAG: PAS domain-containing protein [Chloroflexota bacterium]|nr:PAS domain-containing protein [Chloroflexota bacterium]